MQSRREKDKEAGIGRDRVSKNTGRDMRQKREEIIEVETHGRVEVET